MLELRQLRYFVAVAEAEHVGRAAEKLGISQPPLSRQIQQLEEQLGVALFARSKKRLKLTHAGEKLLHNARELLMHAVDVERQAARDAQGSGGTLSLGSVEGALHARRVQCDIVRFCKGRPRLAVELRVQRSVAIMEALRRGELDAGYVYWAPAAEDPVLQAAPLAEERFVLALPEQHPLAGAQGVRPQQLASEVFVGPPASSQAPARAELVRACETAGFSPEIRFEASEPSTALSLVQAGLGLAFVQESCRACGTSGVAYLDLPWFPVSVRLFIVWRRKAASKLALEYARHARDSAQLRPERC